MREATPRIDMATRPPRLCEKCSSIDLVQARKLEGYQHHSSFAAIRKYAAGGCDLCKLIADSKDVETGRHGNLADSNGETDDPRITCHLYSLNGFGNRLGMHNEDFPHSELSFRQYLRGSPTTYWATLRVFVEHDASTPIKSLVGGRPIEPRADSDLCYSLACKWLDHCLRKHTRACLSNSVLEMPTRLIDIGCLDGPITPRLFVTEGQNGLWAALSHCWGQEAHFVTSFENLNERQLGISISELPPTFLDAMIVARQLGQRYIWIDSLCIIQDSRSDWARESVRMRDYYKQALFTVSSDAASGDHETFLDISRPNEPPLRLTVQLAGGGTSDVQLSKDYLSMRNKNAQTFVNCRAWTLQEYLLSPRTLRFTTKQMIWQCQTQTCLEGDANPADNFANIKRQFLVSPIAMDSDAKYLGIESEERRTSPVSCWYHIHENYAIRLLTFRDDKLPAISGIAREIQENIGFTYKAGIWVEDVSLGLLWDAWGSGKQPEHYRAPSWSWAALDTQYDTNFKGRRGSTYSSIAFEKAEVIKHTRAKFVACGVVSKDGDSYGRAESGYMQLTGRVLPVANWNATLPPRFLAYWTTEKMKNWDFLKTYTMDKPQARDELVFHFDIFPPGSDASTVNLENVTMLQISMGNWTGYKQDTNHVTVALLLEPADDLGNYRRVGIAEVPNYNGLAEAGWELADVAII